MVEGMTAESQRLTHAATASPGHVPAPRTSPENTSRSHRAQTLAALVDDALMIIRRDSLPASGYIVAETSGGAKHEHAVWQLGQFAILGDGWFGQVHGREATGPKPSNWLRKHERRCHEQHWTQFHWIDPALLDVGCGAGTSGLALSPDGPIYCPGFTAGVRHPEHVPLIQIFKDGLQALGAERSR